MSANGNLPMNYINLRTTDAAFNLAAEQYVFDNLPGDRAYFMLWQNDNAIIIGKYQNTLAEINERFVQENNISVIRRLSGGGAVYHDLGNLNFTFITDAEDVEQMNMRTFCEPVVKSLAEMGIIAEINGRNDMTIAGRKFSGNAQYVKNGRVMHHGTLMYDSNMEILQQALHVDPSKIAGKGIQSVRSRVTNIKEYLKGESDIEEFRTLLLKNIALESGAEEYVLSERDYSEIERIKDERYGRWEWNYGRSPECTVHRSGRIEGCGKIDAFFACSRGVIESVRFMGDFFSLEEPEILASTLRGAHMDREGIAAALADVDIARFFVGADREKILSLLCDGLTDKE